LTSKAVQSTRRRTLEVRLLGQVEIAVDGEPFRLATPRKSLQLLAYLLMHRAAPVSRDYVSFLLWPDEEEGVARGRLRSTISDLLRVLPQPGSDFVGTNADEIWWNGEVDLWLDVDEFAVAAKESQRLEEAAALYRGDLLPELYDEWLYGFRERLRNLYLAALTELVSQLRKRGESAGAIEVARRILETDPWREDIVRRIVALRYESGDAAGAVSEFRAFESRLREEMGVSPMPETVALADRVVRGDSADDEVTPASTLPLRATECRQALPFLGREREIERLNEAWSRAKMGRGGIVFVGGEPGIGKSRLVREFMAAVEETGGRALYGATGYPEAFPYQCLVDALREQLPLVAATDIGTTWFAALTGVLPELAARIGALPELPEIRVGDQRRRLFDALARVFGTLARPRPLLVVLEDLHWANQVTFDALTFLLQRITGARILFLATFRDNEALARHPLRRLARDAAVAGSAVSLSIPPLDCKSVERIVALSGASSGEASSKAFAAALHRRSNGNPLFLTQLLERPSPEDTVPTSVASLVGSRFAALAPETQTVAEVAALAGQRFSAELVRDVTGYGDAIVERALDELLDRRLIQETTGRGMLPYLFGHRLVQEAIAALCAPERVRERSGRLARTLRKLYPERSREFSSQIGALFEAAESYDEAAREHAAAGAYALELGAPDDARRDVDHGLAITRDRATIVQLWLLRQQIDERTSNVVQERTDLRELGAIAEEYDDEELRCRVLFRRSRLAFNDYTGRDEVFAPLAQLRERALQNGSTRWRAEADLLESMFYPLGVSASRGVELARRALEGYREAKETSGIARALTEMLHLTLLCGNFDEAERLGTEALEMAEILGDYAISERVISQLHANAIELLDCEAATKWSSRWIDLTVRAGDRRCEADALGQSTWPLQWQPRFLDALPVMERAAMICRECGLMPALMVVEMNAAEFYVKLGAFDIAVSKIERATGAYARVAPLFTEKARSNLIIPYTYGGRAAEAAELGREGVAATRQSENVFGQEERLGNLAEAEYAIGELRGAIEHLEAAAEIRRETSFVQASARYGALLAAFYAQAGDCERSRRYAATVPTQEPECSVGLLWPQRSAWCAAFAHHACGDDTAAHEWLYRAYALYEEHLPYLDAKQQEIFAKLPWHRAMLAAKRGDWSTSAWQL
jgi:DNA-binding SARP family transcriptional activator/tetratricopeptide (TPR) repeat protein